MEKASPLFQRAFTGIVLSFFLSSTAMGCPEFLAWLGTRLFGWSSAPSWTVELPVPPRRPNEWLETSDDFPGAFALRRLLEYGFSALYSQTVALSHSTLVAKILLSEAVQLSESATSGTTFGDRTLGLISLEDIRTNGWGISPIGPKDPGSAVSERRIPQLAQVLSERIANPGLPLRRQRSLGVRNNGDENRTRELLESVFGTYANFAGSFEWGGETFQDGRQFLDRYFAAIAETQMERDADDSWVTKGIREALRYGLPPIVQLYWNDGLYREDRRIMRTPRRGISETVGQRIRYGWISAYRLNRRGEVEAWRFSERGRDSEIPASYLSAYRGTILVHSLK